MRPVAANYFTRYRQFLHRQQHSSGLYQSEHTVSGVCSHVSRMQDPRCKGKIGPKNHLRGSGISLSSRTKRSIQERIQIKEGRGILGGPTQHLLDPGCRGDSSFYGWSSRTTDHHPRSRIQWWIQHPVCFRIHSTDCTHAFFTSTRRWFSTGQCSSHPLQHGAWRVQLILLKIQTTGVQTSMFNWSKFGDDQPVGGSRDRALSLLEQTPQKQLSTAKTISLTKRI